MAGPRASGDNLRDDDEEIKNPHVGTHVLFGKSGADHGIRHGEDAGPGDPHADHRKKENVS